MPITLDGTSGITTPMYGGAISSNAVTPVVGMKNRIINGACVIDQRNAGASVTATGFNNIYTLDRWNALYATGGFYSVQQNAGSVTPPAGFRNYLGVTSLGANTGVINTITQSIEGFNTSDLNWGTANAQTVTLSFWVRSSLTGTFGGAISNSGRTRSYPFSYTISAANTWEYKTITIAGDVSGTWVGATNGVGLNLDFGLGNNATYSGTAGAWASSDFRSATGATSVVGTNGATFYITGVQFEVGSTATSFDYRPYGTELALCQRYFQKTWNTETAVGNGTSIGAQITRVYNTDSFIPQLMTRLPVVMRATPAVTGYDTLTGAVNRLTQAGVSRTISNIFDIGAGTSGFPQSATNPTSGDDCRWHFTASAEL